MMIPYLEGHRGLCLLLLGPGKLEKESLQVEEKLTLKARMALNLKMKNNKLDKATLEYKIFMNKLELICKPHKQDKEKVKEEGLDQGSSLEQYGQKQGCC